jgi:16S rRNA (uracil1498-N3)-methyltransferase
VLRLREGDRVRVFDGGGAEREAILSMPSGARAVVTLRLGEAVEPLPEATVDTTLVCAFPKGARGDWLVEKATELGVARIVPVTAARSVMRPGDGRLKRWRAIATQAAEQCGRAVVPELGGVAAPDAVTLVADPGAPLSVVAALATRPASVVVHIGPEGGWTDEERRRFEASGARLVGLGPRTLRVETAALAALVEVLATCDSR